MEFNNKEIIRLYLLFIPIAFFSYLFHEFGHWIIGEMLGNDMTYSLNYVSPKSGSYLKPEHNLYVSIGGPAFTILLALISFILVEIYRSVFFYAVLFFQFSLRSFSLVFGGFAKQDEARIAEIMGIGSYTVGILVIAVLFIIVLRSSFKLKIDLKQNGYFFTVSIIAQLIVIAVYNLFDI